MYGSTFPSPPPVPTTATIYDVLLSPKWNKLLPSPDTAALIDAPTGDKLTYGQLASQSLSLAAGLKSYGLKEGDAILLYSPNSLVYPVCILAAAAAGILCTTANSGYTPPELAHQINDSKSKLVFAAPELVNVALEALKETKLTEKDIVILPGGGSGGKNLRPLKDLMGDGSKHTPFSASAEALARDPAILPYSSGTTGRAKGVEVSHSNLVNVLWQCTATGLFDESLKTVIGFLPMYHIFGTMIAFFLTIRRGGTLVIMPKFDFPLFCESVARYKISFAPIVPPVALALAKSPLVEKYDLSTIKLVLIGAAPLSVELQQALATRLKGARVIQGFGMTETTCVALLPALDDNAEGVDVADGQGGELWLKGPNILLRYRGLTKETGDTFSNDGWFKTGDVCVRSKEGNYSIIDRTKELIKYKGFQVPPAELEAVLIQSPLVADAAVIGVYAEDQATELPRGYVVLSEAAKGKAGALDEIKKFVESKVAPHKRLRGGLHTLDVIPKSPSGKILRKDLRKLAAEETPAKGSKL